MNSPFVANNGGRQPNIDDLILAIRVCSTKTWAEALYGMSLMDKIRLSSLKANFRSQELAMRDFSVYLEESLSMPKVWVKTNMNGVDKQEKKKQDIPTTLSLVVFLMSKLNMSEEEAWETPFSRAIWYTVGYASQESGDVSVISTEEEEREEQDKKMLDEIERKAKEALRK